VKLEAGFTRLYRAEGVPGRIPDWIKQGQDASGHTEAAGRWFTSDPENLKWYQEDSGPNARVTYVEVLTSDLEKYRVSNSKEEIAGRRVASFSRDPSTEFFLPRDLAESRKIYTPNKKEHMENNYDLPSGQRIWELAQRAIQIEKAANQSSSLSYELYEVQVNSQADRAMRTMDPAEKRFFETCFQGVYTPPDQRGQDWQSEHEIRQELAREMYGEEEYDASLDLPEHERDEDYWRIE
jgi:hypothetical protein